MPLASLLNDYVWNVLSFRSRNTKRLPGQDGHLIAGPRLFTTAAVRGILHSPFYMEKVAYKGKLAPWQPRAVTEPGYV